MSFHPEFEPNYIPPVDVSTPEERELSQWKKKAEGIVSGERSWYQYEGIQGNVFIDCLNLKDINAEKAWKRDTVSPDKMAGLEGINITTDPVPQKIDEGFLRGMLKDKEFMATLINKREVEREYLIRLQRSKIKRPLKISRCKPKKPLKNNDKILLTLQHK